jgi:hypothetical protein
MSRYFGSVIRRTLPYLTDTESEGYLIFLKKQILKLSPEFVALRHVSNIKTKGGVMVLVVITEDIENPILDSAAMARINNVPLILWNDHVYTTGIIVKSGNSSLKTVDGKAIALIHKIGTDPI